MHIYGETSVSPDVQQSIITFTTPVRGEASCSGFVLWGEVTSEFYIYKNGELVGGGRTSAANPTLQLDYAGCSIGLNGGDTIEVKGEHVSKVARVLKVVIMVNLS